MKTTSETNPPFEQLSSKIYAKRPHENNKKVCIDCLKPRSNKNKLECKNCGCTKFYVQLVKYKMTVLSKIKPHSDAVDYCKELPFYNKPTKKPKVKHLKNIDRLLELHE